MEPFITVTAHYLTATRGDEGNSLLHLCDAREAANTVPKAEGHIQRRLVVVVQHESGDLLNLRFLTWPQLQLVIKAGLVLSEVMKAIDVARGLVRSLISATRQWQHVRRRSSMPSSTSRGTGSRLTVQYAFNLYNAGATPRMHVQGVLKYQIHHQESHLNGSRTVGADAVATACAETKGDHKPHDLIAIYLQQLLVKVVFKPWMGGWYHSHAAPHDVGRGAWIGTTPWNTWFLSWFELVGTIPKCNTEALKKVFHNISPLINLIVDGIYIYIQQCNIV